MEQAMKTDFVYNILYTKLLTWSFNLARDFIERMTTLQWLLQVPPYLRSRDWEVGMEAILIQTRLDVGTKSAEL